MMAIDVNRSQQLQRGYDSGSAADFTASAVLDLAAGIKPMATPKLDRACNMDDPWACSPQKTIK